MTTRQTYSAERLAGMLIEIGAKEGPLHHRLSTGISELIDRGELPPLAVLPSERALADALMLSRTTVVTAYQRLRDDGRVQRRRGSGTWVQSGSDGASSAGRETVSGALLAGDHVATPFLNGPLATIDFATAALPSLDLVAEEAAALTLDDYRRLGVSHHGYHPRGLPALRERIAEWYTSHGVPTSADEVVITSGAQQALELIARGCLEPGDGVVVEAPTYRGALETFARTGSRVRAVRTDRDGMDVDALEHMLAAWKSRLIYVQAPAHNPTGAVLPSDRRRRLVNVAGAESAILVDDTSLAGTVFEGKPSAPVLDGSGDTVVTIGSMSKLFWGGLRIGWVRASSRVVSRLAQVKGITDLGTSLVSQQIAARLLDRVDEAAEQRRRTLSAGLVVLTSALAEHLPDWSWQQPRAGASLWVRLPHGDATHFAHVALRYGVALLPGAVFSHDRHTDDHTRLPYALPADVVREGVLRLGRAWHAYLDGGVREVSLTSAIT